MTHIQFGWALPFNSGNTSRRDQLAAYQQGLDVIAGHFDSAWMGDHVQFGTEPVLEAWTAMNYLAALQPKLKFGHLVLCQLFRNPAHLAKMAATLQYMSEGRFILGLGAGWHQEECDAYHFPFLSPGRRIEELDEALHIIKSMWNQDHVTFAGKHHQVNDANCQPKPDPLPPIMVAAFQPRMLRLTARHADWWNTQGCDLQKITSQVQAYEQACNTVGRDPATLRRTLQLGCYCAPTEKELKNMIDQKNINRDWSLVGTPEQIVEQLRPFIDLGFDYFIIGADDFPHLTTLETLTNEVLPLLTI